MIKILDERDIPAIAEEIGVVESASGSIISIKDASDYPLKNLIAHGKTTQKTTTGKNQLKLLPTSHTLNGITITVNDDDGSIKTNGTATDDVYLIVGSMDYKGGTAYTVSGCPSGGANETYNMYAIYGDGIYAFDYGNGCTFTPAEDMTKNVLILIKKGVTVSNKVYYPMVRLASITDATFEKYTGGIASPNPNYPQALTNVGDSGSSEVGVYGGNILDLKQRVIGSGGTYTVDNDSIIFTGYENIANYFPFGVFVDVLPNTWYTLTFNATSIKTVYIYSDWYFGNQLGQYGAIDGKVTFYSGNYNRVLLGLYSWVAERTGTSETISNLMVNVGGDALPYEEFKGSQIMSMPYTLPGVPVSSGGNYTDENGKHWICDEVNFEKGKYTQRTKLLDLTKITKWNTWGVNYRKEGYTGFYCLNTDLGENISLGTEVIDVVCSIAPHKGDLWGGAGLGAYSTKDGNQYIAICVPNDVLADVSSKESAIASFVDLLANTNAKMVVTIVPIETDLTSEQLEAFASLKSHKGCTNVFTNDIGEMTVEYTADLKSYIDNKFTQLQALILEV